MTPIPVPVRWLAALLGLALVLDTYLILENSPRLLLALPGALLAALCALFAMYHPVLGAVLGALAITLSSALLPDNAIGYSSLGIYDLTLTEVTAGAVLVVLVVWRAPVLPAAGGVAALIVAYGAALTVRATYCLSSEPCGQFSGLIEVVRPSDVFMSVLFGAVLLACAVGTGIYLRRSAANRIQTELTTLIRKQWPLGAAIALLAMLELSDGGNGYAAGVTILGGVAAGILAFFAPMNPVRNAWLGAGALLCVGLLTTSFYGRVWPFSFTAVGAAMALIAYVVRYAPARPAAFGSLAVAVGAFFSIIGTDVYLLSNTRIATLPLVGMAVAVVTGWYFRTRDRERHQTVRSAVTSAQQGERLALARELHDVVAHHVTGIVVQAQAALHVATTNPGAAAPALEKIERSGTEALTAMRLLVGGLRDGTAVVVEQATTDLAADIDALVANFTGPPVELELDLPERLPPETGRSVLRLVQESLTNVGKHAPDATTATVRVTPADDTLHLRVSDDGRTRPANPPGGSGGYGLVGMRERVELLGGRFEAGPSGAVGWLVEAWLPLRKEGS